MRGKFILIYNFTPCGNEKMQNTNINKNNNIAKM